MIAGEKNLFDDSDKKQSDESVEVEPEAAEVVLDDDSPKDGHVVYTMVPGTIDDLAARTEDFRVLIEARYETVDLLRRRSIALTYPGDWLQFGSDEEAFGYLQGGKGCERVMQLWGVNVVNLGPMERIDMTDDDGKKAGFYYCIRGDGECNVTKSKGEGFEGICGSDDDFLFTGRGEDKRPKKPLQREKEMRHAARTRLDGIVTRSLMGLKAIPISEIQRIWNEAGHAHKATAKIPKGKGAGKGFGTSAERAGADTFIAPGYKASEAPKCPKCSKQMKFVPKGAKHDAFWSCPDRDNCGGTREFVPRDSSGRK